MILELQTNTLQCCCKLQMAINSEKSWNSAGVSRLCAMFAKFCLGSQTVKMHICQESSLIRNECGDAWYSGCIRMQCGAIILLYQSIYLESIYMVLHFKEHSIYIF